MLESKVQKEIIAYLTKNRVYHWRFQAQSNLNGIPDILCLYKGFFIGLELKKPKHSKATELQLRKIKTINDNGGIGVVVKSVEEVDKLFKIIDNHIGCYGELTYYIIKEFKESYEKK